MGASVDRRSFLKSSAATVAGASLSLSPARSLFAQAEAAQPAGEPLYKISLAEWSLVSMLRGGELDNLDFPAFAKEQCGIEAVEYVNQFFMDKGKDNAYFTELKKRCDDIGVTSLLIMCDDRANLGDPDEAARTAAVEMHYQWVEAAKLLGCHSIRVNARSSGSEEEQMELIADGLRRLCEFAQPHGLNVIVENHGGLSSNGAWLAETIRKVDLENCGTLPDFGNFTVARGEVYDRYKGVEELMPLAKGVSAKSYGFDEAGNETQIDYERMMRIVVDAGYRGYVGVEWEGRGVLPVEGVRLTKQLLERVRDRLSAAASAG